LNHVNSAQYRPIIAKANAKGPDDRPLALKLSSLTAAPLSELLGVKVNTKGEPVLPPDRIDFCNRHGSNFLMVPAFGAA